MKLKAKICGLTRREDIAAANELLPDYIGMVFYPKSKRAVSREQASALKAQLDKRIQAVGVFVNAELDFIAGLVHEGIIDVVQLHGDEDAEYIKALRAAVSVPVIKAIRVRGPESLANLAQYEVDYFLFDTYKAGMYGGTGERFSFDLASGVEIPKPYFIAGGLDPDNVREVAAQYPAAYAVDVSGGVEDPTTGLKSYALIKKFLSQLRVAR